MKTKGIFIGLCGMDVVFYSAAPLPTENSKIKTDSFLRQVGGPAANAALTFAALGNEAVLYAFVGYDDTGLWLERKLESSGVRLVRISNTRGAGGTEAGISNTRGAGGYEADISNTRGAGGTEADISNTWQETDISTIFVNTAAGTRTIISGQKPKTGQDFKADENGFAGADFILYDGNLPGIEEELMRYVDSHQVELVLDAGSYKPGFPTCFSGKTTVIASESFKNPEGQDIFHYRGRLKDCAVTRGEKSILYYENEDETENGNRGEIGVKSDHPAVDTLAAGDIFHGAYCHFRYDGGLDFVTSLEKASEVATQSTCCIGTERYYEQLHISHITNQNK